MHLIPLLLLVPCLASLSVSKPKCFECKHFIPDRSLFDSKTFGTCAIFSDADISTKFASTCRRDENMCGENGHYYIEEENMVRKYATAKICSSDLLP